MSEESEGKLPKTLSFVDVFGPSVDGEKAIKKPQDKENPAVICPVARDYEKRFVALSYLNCFGF
ncbi:MAG: hypothetical protein VZR31_09125 [Lachnospiraceae bacterium]|jgi:hypothetical protein|nr:hypothetical protein [Lachnospiraceae bacterium]